MPPARLLQRSDARRYLFGQGLSFVGDTAMILALGIWAKELTGRTSAAGFVFVALAIPAVLAPAAGLLVDSVPRRELLIATNIAGAVVLTPLAFVHGSGDVWIVYLVAVLYGAVGALIGAGQSAFLKDLLPTHLLGDANAALATIEMSTRLVSPLLGAGMYAWVGGRATAAVDAVTFLVAAVVLGTIRSPIPLTARDRGSVRVEIWAGIRHIAHGSRALRQIVTVVSAAFLVVGFAETAVFALVDDGLHRGASFVGVLLSLQGVGAVVGGPTSGRIGLRVGYGRLCAGGMVLLGCSAALLAVGSLPAAMAGMVIGGVGLPWLTVGMATSFQRLTPSGLQGRVTAAANGVITATQLVSLAVGASLIGVLGYRVEFIAVAVGMIAGGVWLGLQREQQVPESGG
jgi:MFS family permease